MLRNNFSHSVTSLRTALVTRCSLQWCYIKPRTHWTKHLYTIHMWFVDLTSLSFTWGKHMMNYSSGKSWTNILSLSQTMRAAHKHEPYNSMNIKYALYPKIIQIKVVEHWILYKKVSRRICLSNPWIKLRGSKDCHLLKYYNVQKWGSRFTLGLGTGENTR